VARLLGGIGAVGADDQRPVAEFQKALDLVDDGRARASAALAPAVEPAAFLADRPEQPVTEREVVKAPVRFLAISAEQRQPFRVARPRPS